MTATDQSGHRYIRVDEAVLMIEFQEMYRRIYTGQGRLFGMSDDFSQARHNYVDDYHDPNVKTRAILMLPPPEAWLQALPPQARRESHQLALNAHRQAIQNIANDLLKGVCPEGFNNADHYALGRLNALRASTGVAMAEGRLDHCDF